MASSFEASTPVEVENVFGPSVEALTATTTEEESSFAAAGILGASRDGVYVRQFLITSLPLWLSDQLSLFASLLLSSFVVTAWHAEVAIDWSTWIIGLSIAGTMTSWILGLYPAVGLAAEAELRLTALSGVLLFGGAAVAHTSWAGAEPASSLLIAYGGILFLAVAPLLRRQARGLASRTSWWAQPVLIFGGGQSGLRVFRTLLNAPECGLRPIGIVDDLHRHWRDDKNQSLVVPGSDVGCV